MHKLLVVDDNETNIKLLSLILKKENYEIETCLDPTLAFKKLQEERFDLVLTDINMPEIDGFELCRRIKTDDALKKIPVIYISALSDTDDIVKGFQAGGVDYITKPFKADEVKARVRTHLEIFDLRNSLEKKVDEKVEQLAQTQMETIFSLAKLAQSRDDDTGSHLERVQEYCKELSLELQKTPKYQSVIDDRFVKNIFHASPLHDIGKVGIPDSILLKNGRLTPEEFDEMKKHTTIGAETLKEVNQKFGQNAFIEMGLVIAEKHHEKWDGTGYPFGISGEEIPLPARIMALADVYDALRAKRVYKEPFSHEKSRDIILEGRGTHFDPDIVDAFMAINEKFNDICESKRN